MFETIRMDRRTTRRRKPQYAKQTQYGNTEISTGASVRRCAVSESMLADFLTVIPHTVVAAGADEFLDPSASLVLDPSNDGQCGVAV